MRLILYSFLKGAYIRERDCKRNDRTRGACDSLMGDMRTIVLSCCFSWKSYVIYTTMKILYCVLLSLFVPVQSPKAQTVQGSPSAKRIVEYQSPSDGDDFVMQKTTLTIRLTKQYVLA